MALLIIFGAATATTLYFLNRGSASDSLRAADITKLQATVQRYADDNKKLPDSLKDLKSDSTLTYTDYTYQKNSSSEFSICSTFKTDTHLVYGSYGNSTSPNAHTIGYQCFKNTVWNLKPVAPVTYQPAPAPTSAQSTFCGKAYDSFAVKPKPVAKVTFINLQQFSNKFSTTGGPGGTDIWYHWDNQVPLVYDINCKQLKLQDVQVNQQVVVYATADYSTSFVMIAP